MHEELCEILGSRYVYFSPPESIKLTYPCIVYTLAGVNKQNANNSAYRSTRRYELTVIDKNPDSEIFNDILTHFSMCSFDRNFKSNNLNHNVLTLYY